MTAVHAEAPLHVASIWCQGDRYLTHAYALLGALFRARCPRRFPIVVLLLTLTLARSTGPSAPSHPRSGRRRWIHHQVRHARFTNDDHTTPLLQHPWLNQGGHPPQPTGGGYRVRRCSKLPATSTAIAPAVSTTGAVGAMITPMSRGSAPALVTQRASHAAKIHGRMRPFGDQVRIAADCRA